MMKTSFIQIFQYQLSSKLMNIKFFCLWSSLHLSSTFQCEDLYYYWWNVYFHLFL